MSSGGARKGAGRPKMELRAVSVRVAPEVAECLRAEAERRGVSQRVVIEDLVNLVAKNNKL